MSDVRRIGAAKLLGVHLTQNPSFSQHIDACTLLGQHWYWDQQQPVTLAMLTRTNSMAVVSAHLTRYFIDFGIQMYLLVNDSTAHTSISSEPHFARHHHHQIA